MQRPIKLHFPFCCCKLNFLHTFYHTCLDYCGFKFKINFLINTFFSFRLDMLSLKGDKRNLTLFLTLFLTSATYGQILEAETITHSSLSPTSLISNQNSLRSNDESISNKLTQIRHLLKSLFFDWNLESEAKGKVQKETFRDFPLMSTQPKQIKRNFGKCNKN